MKKPMLLMSHKAGVCTSDLPGLKGRSFVVPLPPPQANPPSLHRGDERGQCHEISTSCGFGKDTR